MEFVVRASVPQAFEARQAGRTLELGCSSHDVSGAKCVFAALGRSPCEGHREEHPDRRGDSWIGTVMIAITKREFNEPRSKP
jgi:hypothetical protein